MEQLDDVNLHQDPSLIPNMSPLQSPSKKSGSVLNYIINHRNKVIEKTFELKNLSEVDSLSNETTKESLTQDMKINQQNENIEKIEKIENKRKRYYKSIRWFSIYVLFGIIGGLLINAITQVELLNFDMIFNILISPIIYYHSPRKILTKISIKQFGIYYTIPFVLGLLFRFLDQISIINQFVLNPNKIQSINQIVLLILLIFGILIISAYYIFISTFPLVNTILLSINFLITFISLYIYYQSGGNIHVHHYFLALCIMLLSRNPHSNIVNIIHALAYGIYIEGISKWGMAALFWSQ